MLTKLGNHCMSYINTMVYVNYISLKLEKILLKRLILGHSIIILTVVIDNILININYNY